MWMFCVVFQLLVLVYLQEIVNHQHSTLNNTILSVDLAFTTDLLAPDGWKQEGITINGHFPGPPIRISPNHKHLIVNVQNQLPRGLAIHFHGIHQVGTVSSDGVPGITQTEIPSGGTYTYKMDVDAQAGTFMYHAHTGLDQNWAMGSLILEDEVSLGSIDERYKYDYEKTLLLSQCWHVSMTNISDGITGVPFADIPDASSLLINGLSFGNWSENTSVEGYDVIRVQPNTTYRFRVIGLGLDSMLSLRIHGHKFQVIEADGILVEPVETDHLLVNAAQRYSILITMDQEIGNYWIETEMVPGPGPRNGRAILHYTGAPDPTPLRTQIFHGETPEVELSPWILSELTPSRTVFQKIVYPVPIKVDKEIVIRSQEVNLPDGRTKFRMNGYLHTMVYNPPLLHQIRERSFSNDSGLIPVSVGETIQMVFVNTMSDDGECEQHPWHFHGHSIYVVGQGPDDYNSEEAESIIESNLAHGRLEFRDVITLFPNQTDPTDVSSGTHCGWIAVRFVANNPGLWMVHCHLTAHMLMGKFILLHEFNTTDPHLLQIH